jgi:hypothetical protein
LPEAIRKAAVSAILNIFETMFFTLLEPMEGDVSFPADGEGGGAEGENISSRQLLPLLKSEISFEGRYSGRLILLVPYALGETLTQNFMGFEEEVSESQILDMAAELANMICGNLFSTMDKTSVYALSSPVTRKSSQPMGMEIAETADLTLSFLADDQPLTVQIEFSPRSV